MRRLAASLETLVAWVGRAAAWATLPMVLVTFGVVVLRYVLSMGWQWLQECTLYLHSLVFLLAAGNTLQTDGHVRVDIVYGRMGPRGRAWVDLVGTILFLLPFCALIAVKATPFVMASWATRETSPEPGGLPFVFGLKTLLLAYAALLCLQGLASALRAGLRLGRWEEPGPKPSSPQEPQL